MKILLLISILFFCFLTVAKAQSTIRKVDFKNFTYNLSCGSADKKSSLTVKSGEFRGNKKSIGTGETVYLKIYEVKFGDFDGDKKEEAVVLYSCSSGASYVYFRGLVFKMKNRKPTFLTDIEGGNKGDGGFHEVRIAKNQLIVERYQLPQAGSPCCPAFIETTRYNLKGNRLVPIGRKSVRKISFSS
jgi:hypothetical protein